MLANTGEEAQALEHSEMLSPHHSEMHALYLPQASNDPVVMNTELDSSNQQQSMDTPSKQPELDWNINAVILDRDIDVWSAIPVHWISLSND